ncbi:MAG: site-2 protease family protein, partial [Actinomycetes bacterium]
LWLARAWFPTMVRGYPPSAYWFCAVVGVIALLVSLVGHELGHSWVAARNNVGVVEITLWMFGGVAKLEGDADNPGAEFRIAAAGPAASAVIGALFGAAAWVARSAEANGVFVALMVWLALTNVLLALSNLLPAYPLDGGRMLRATMWRRSLRKRRATQRAALIGQVFSVALVVIGIVLCFTPSVISGLGVILMGLFVLLAAQSEWRASSPQPGLLDRSVGDLGRVLPGPLGHGATVSDLEQLVNAHPRTVLVPVVDASGRVSTVVSPEAVTRIPPAQRHVVPVASLGAPMWSLPRVHPDEPLRSVLDRLGRGEQWRAIVTDGTSPRSVLCSEDVDRVVELATV